MAKSPQRVESTTLPVQVEEESPAPVPVSQMAADQHAPAVTVTQLSELDSYIVERMKGQPADLDGVASRVQALERKAKQRHRLVLPDFFEALSYDNVASPGPYIFRWLFKEKRAIDRALNVLGWTLVNRTYFPQAPRYLFTANGGVEVGDSLLAFMPAKRALELRAEPAQKSQARINARTTQVDQDYVLMTGNPKDERVYQPQLGSESSEEAGAPVGGELVEGRDF